MSINRWYCAEPLSTDKVFHIHYANCNKFRHKVEGKEVTDCEQLYPVLVKYNNIKTKKVFLHKECKLPKNDKLSIIATAFHKAKGNGKAVKEAVIYDAIETLMQADRTITRQH
jgi:hypothetical protein